MRFTLGCEVHLIWLTCRTQYGVFAPKITRCTFNRGWHLRQLSLYIRFTKPLCKPHVGCIRPCWVHFCTSQEVQHMRCDSHPRMISWILGLLRQNDLQLQKSSTDSNNLNHFKLCVTPSISIMVSGSDIMHKMQTEQGTKTATVRQEPKVVVPLRCEM